MGGAKGVVLTFIAARKARQPAQLAQGAHALAPARQYFVRIGLVTHIPHQPVVRRVENIVQRHRQFDRAEVGAQVTAGLGDAVKHIGTQFVGQPLELGARKPPQIGRTVNGFK